MNRLLRSFSPRFLVLLFAAALVPAAAGCGGNVSPATGSQGTGGSAGTGGTAGTGGAAACQLAPSPGMFTFHVHNGGSKTLRLAYGCGANLPIVLTTPMGMLSAGPGAVDTCEFTCEVVYGGQQDGACSDCGGGYGADLGPGMTADIKWDRRVYTAHMSPPQCTGGMAEGCALGEPVASTTMQKGVLDVCTDTGTSGAGYCASTSLMPVSFTIDTTQAAGTIEVQ